MVVDELVRLQDLAEETLSWTRPNFFELRYQLAGPAGVAARISVTGIGSQRRVLGETAQGSWFFQVFPLDQPDVRIWPVSEAQPVGHYRRGPNLDIHLEEHIGFQYRKENALKSLMEDCEGNLVLSLEQVEAFPRWRVEMKLAPGRVSLPETPLLIACCGCILVFD